MFDWLERQATRFIVWLAKPRRVETPKSIDIKYFGAIPDGSRRRPPKPYVLTARALLADDIARGLTTTFAEKCSLYRMARSGCICWRNTVTGRLPGFSTSQVVERSPPKGDFQ